MTIQDSVFVEIRDKVAENHAINASKVFTRKLYEMLKEFYPPTYDNPFGQPTDEVMFQVDRIEKAIYMAAKTRAYDRFLENFTTSMEMIVNGKASKPEA